MIEDGDGGGGGGGGEEVEDGSSEERGGGRGEEAEDGSSERRMLDKVAALEQYNQALQSQNELLLSSAGALARQVVAQGK
jgi:hypothetical protein